MEKRYQIFISSTFTDLVDERREVLKGVLELRHMPAGMELFAAGDDAAWTLIKDVIDGSDYYVLIIGGRYGSRDSAGLGFTEKEYDHAVKKRKPVIALLHKSPDSLPRAKTETESASWKKLTPFRTKVEKSHTCSYWQTPEELKAKALLGILGEIERKPAVGWIRGDRDPSLQPHGVRRIADKYDFNPDFWNSLMCSPSQRIDLVGHALSKWLEEPYKPAFIARLSETATSGGMVRILVLKPDGEAHHRRASAVGVVYKKRTEQTLRTLCQAVLPAIPESHRGNIDVRWADEALYYMLVRTDQITVVSPYLPASDSKHALVLVLDSGSKYATTYANDFSKLFDVSEGVVWPPMKTKA